MSDHDLTIKARSGFEIFRGKLNAFWLWWTDELLGLMPLSVRSKFKITSKMLLVRITGTQCCLLSRTGQSEEKLTEFSLEDNPDPDEISQRKSLSNMADDTVLQLPNNFILYKTISLPEATANKLENVLAFEMDRNTPFKAEDIYFTYRIKERDSQQQKIQVELVIVTRKVLDDLLNKLADRGITINRVVPAGLDYSKLDHPDRNLLPHTSGTDKRSAQQKKQFTRFWTLIVIILLIAFGSLYQRYQRAEQLEQEVEAPRALAMKAKSTRDEFELLQQSRSYMINRKVTEPSTLMLLKSLTEIIPDNTWLVRMNLNTEGVTLQGESADSSALISLIESADDFENVRFSSPVTINPRTQKERFSITAQLQSENINKRGEQP